MTFEKTLNRLAAEPEEPDKEFVVSGMTYGEIYALAEYFRNELRARQPADQQVCLLTADKGVLLAALLAVLGGGTGRLILPYTVSPGVLEEMKRTTGVGLAITDDLGVLPTGMGGILPAFDSGELRLTRALEPDTEIVRLYTGGSTGKPKTWSKTVQNLFGEACYLAEKFGVGPDDRFAATVPICHIYGLLFAVLVPFVARAQVLAETPVFPAEITAALANSAATVLVSVPMHYRVLAGQKFVRKNLRLAFSSAGPLDEVDGKRFYNQTGVGVVEIYGSTETGGIAARCRAAGETAFHPFGVLDWRIAGERLQVRSEFLSRELPVDLDGFFQTGDRVAFSDDGFVLKGRADGIVKIGGRRVDLEEIRDKILAAPRVADAVVVSLPATAGREKQVAVMASGNAAAEEIRRHLDRLLEPYARPRVIKIVEKIPVTTAGKYDHRRIEQLLEGVSAPLDAAATPGSAVKPAGLGLV